MCCVPCLSFLVLVAWQGLAPAAQVQLQPILPTGHSSVLTGVSLSGDGKLLATGSVDGTAILWEAAAGKKLRTFSGHSHWVMGVSLSGDGKHLVTASIDGKAILWETATGTKLRVFEGEKFNGINSVHLSGDGKLLALGAGDNTATLWETATGNRLQTFKGHTNFVSSVSLSGDGQLLATECSTKRWFCGRQPPAKSSGSSRATRPESRA